MKMVGKQLVQRCSSRLFRFTKTFSLELFYFLLISSLGFCILRSLDGRTTTTTTFTPKNLDLFFTAVSAVTVSSMSTVEMEFFSNTQLVILTVLMFIGGEVFFSTVVHFIRMFFDSSRCYRDTQYDSFDTIELNNIKLHEFGNFRIENYTDDLKYKSLKFLGVVAFFYLLFVLFLGLISVFIYLNVTSTAKTILNNKGINTVTFSIFTSVSTLVNCGFVPTNENMLIFRKNSGLLLILIPQALLGNTLYPPALRFSIWVTGKFVKKTETRYLLNNSSYKDIGYPHLHCYKHSLFLLVTVLGLIIVQFVLFSSIEWGSESLIGLNVYQKLVGILFQSVNSRHTGESIVDLSTVSGAILVVFVVMMYLPPYTIFLPKSEQSCEQGNKTSRKMVEKLMFSQQTYLVIFIILVCIIEREQMVNDPLNFNVLNIVVEVISAYGNVGFSTGYSCERRLKQYGSCENKWYGFSGKWSDEGKLVLIVVMIFGRLKKFNMNGGKTWMVL